MYNVIQYSLTIQFKLSLSLLFQVIDHITLLVEDWFSGVRPRFLVVPCPHCSHALPPHPVKLLRSHSINPDLRPSNVEAQQHVSSNRLELYKLIFLQINLLIVEKCYVTLEHSLIFSRLWYSKHKTIHVH